MKDIMELRDEFCIKQGELGIKCSMCPLSIANNGVKLLCSNFCAEYPEDAMEIIKGIESEDVISEAEFQMLLGKITP